ncbi:hypothetical protein F7U66_10910 [Vibrio parahaemolyticus]|nr:hypothetical protein [Vibrio parahaemolyticus]
MSKHTDPTIYVASLLVRSMLLTDNSEATQELSVLCGEDKKEITPERFEKIREVFMPHARQIVLGKQVLLGDDVYCLEDACLIRKEVLGNVEEDELDRALSVVCSKYFNIDLMAISMWMTHELKKCHIAIHQLLLTGDRTLPDYSYYMNQLSLFGPAPEIIDIGNGYFFGYKITKDERREPQTGYVFNDEVWIEFSCSEEGVLVNIAKDIVKEIS